MTTTMASLPSPPPSFLYGFLIGAILYILSRRLSPILTATFGTPSFKQHVAALDDEALDRYHSLLPSMVHAIVQIIGTYSFVLYGRPGYDDKLSEGASPEIVFDERIFVPYGLTHLGPTIYMGIFVGYLMADVVCAPTLATLGYPFVVHHLAASACWTFSACYRVMQPVGSLFQFNELSTPLMNIRQHMLTAGWSSSDPPVAMLSLAFFVMFGLVRVAPLPFVIKDWIYRDFDAIRQYIGLGGAIVLSTFFAVNVALQCGWFLIMCGKFVDMFIKPKKAKQESEEKKVE